MLCIGFSGDTPWNVSWSSGTCREVQSIPDGHLGKVDVLLGCINSFAPEVLVHLLEADTLIVDVRLFINNKPMGFARDGLQKG